MRLMIWHILRPLATSTFSVAAVLVAGVWLTQSLRYVDVIVNRGVSLAGYFSLVGFLIPELLALILPICVLVGVLFTYNRLRTDSELLVFQASGVSYWQLAKPAFLWSLIVCFLIFILNLYVVPSSFRQLRTLDHQIRNEFSTSLLREGTFNSFRNTTIYVKSHLPQGELRGIFIYHKASPSKKTEEVSPPFAIIADKGVLHVSPTSTRLILENGQRQEFDPRTHKSSFFRFSTLNYDLEPLYATKQTRIIKPCERTLGELFFPDENTVKTLGWPQLRAEAHQRLLFPFLALMYAIVAVAFLLLSSPSRHKRLRWIWGAIGTSAAVHTALILLINFNSLSLCFIPLAYGILGTTIVATFFSLKAGSLGIKNPFSRNTTQEKTL